MVYQVRADVFDYLTLHPDAESRDLIDKLGIPGRSARRYIKMWREGEAVRGKQSRAESEVVEAEYRHIREIDLDVLIQAIDTQQNPLWSPVVTSDRIRLKTDQPIMLMFFSCTHLGSYFTNHRIVRDLFREALNTENFYVVSLGDLIDGFPESFYDKSAPRQQVIPLAQQQQIIQLLLLQLNDADKILWGHGGQHDADWEIKREGWSQIKRFFVEELKVTYFDGQAYVKLTVNDVSYYISSAHVFPGTSYNNPNYSQVKHLMTRVPNADIVVQGDKHAPAYQKITIYPDEYHMGNRQSQFSHLIQVGTTKTGNDPYTIKNFPPGQFGWPILILRHDTHDIKVVWSFEDARRLTKIPLDKGVGV